MNYRPAILTFICSGGFFFFTESDAIPPYPIIFIHGLGGNDRIWQKVGLNGRLHEIARWKYGGRINICLDYNNTDLAATNLEEDVRIFDPISKRFYQNSDSVTLPRGGDYYHINFHIDSHGRLYKLSTSAFLSPLTLDQREIVVKDTSRTVEESIFQVGYLIRIQDEVMRVTGVRPVQKSFSDFLFLTDYKIEISVERSLYNTPKAEFYSSIQELPGQEISILSNQSNQAAIQKQGRGVKLAIDAVKKATGANKVILVGHSMGGLAARAYIQSREYGNDVAKLITTSTPHLGSQVQDISNQLKSVLVTGIIADDIFTYIRNSPLKGIFADIDERSDAVRDLSYTNTDTSESFAPNPPFGDFPDDGKFLFGGDERELQALIADKLITRNYLYYTADVNCNGRTDDSNITGLNSLEFPPSVGYHWIAATSFDGPPEGDGVVQLRRQVPIPTLGTLQFIRAVHIPGVLEKLKSTNPPPPIEAITKNIDAIIRGLDEPDSLANAYGIPKNTPIEGFITQIGKSNKFHSDQDFYKFYLPTRNNVTITISNINSDISQFAVFLYSSSLNLIGQQDIEQPNSSDRDYIRFTTNPLEAGEYYVKIQGLATETSWNQPYVLEIQTDIAETPPNYYALSRPFTLDLRLYDSDGNLAYGPSSITSPAFPLDTRSKLGIAISPSFTLDTRPHLSFTLEATTLNFGEVVVGRSNTLTLPILNTGDADLLLRIASALADSFQLVSLDPLLTPGKQGSLQVSFQPNRLGEFNTRVVIKTNVPGQDSVYITLLGTGIEVKLPGDFDGNAEVDFSDFFLFADAFGSRNPLYDLDGNGTVDFADFFILADNFGKEDRAKLISLAQEYIGLPRVSQLEQNYPNPFNPTTNIKYQLASESNAEIVIYDILGRRVKSFSYPMQFPGYYTIQWDGRDDAGVKVAGGVYFYRINTEVFINTKKMLLIK